MILYVKDKKRFFLYFCLLMVLGFCVSAFFWMPAFFEGKYTLRNIVTAGVYRNRFVSLRDLFYGPWSYGGSGQFTVQLGVFQWIFFLFAMISLPIAWKKRRKKLPFVVILLLTTVFAIILMLPITNFLWSRIVLLQNFQFPWRFVAITVFSTATLGSYSIEFLPKKLHLFVVVFSVSIILLVSKDYWHAKSYSLVPEKYFTGVYNSTTDTGESAPIWSVRFMEKRPKTYVEIDSGKAQFMVVSRKVVSHTYTISVLSEKAKIVENTLYFPGWHIFIDNKEVPVEFQDQFHRGLMEFFVPHGDHQIIVAFKETKLRLISDIISIVSFIFLITLIVLV